MSSTMRNHSLVRYRSYELVNRNRRPIEDMKLTKRLIVRSCPYSTRVPHDNVIRSRFRNHIRLYFLFLGLWSIALHLAATVRNARVYRCENLTASTDFCATRTYLYGWTRRHLQLIIRIVTYSPKRHNIMLFPIEDKVGEQVRLKQGGRQIRKQVRWQIRGEKLIVS